jgi:hypothetical protein
MLIPRLQGSDGDLQQTGHVAFFQETSSAQTIKAGAQSVAATHITHDV